MKIEIPQKTLSDTQKANIVSRGEPLSRNNLYFEMDARYAATLSKLSYIYGGHFKVNEEPLYIYFDNYTRQESVNGYDENGKWKELIPDKNLADVLADTYANGEIQLGGNVDSIMQEMTDIYQRIDEIRANTKRIDAEKRLKEEEERPAKEAREKAEKEEKYKKDAEEKAKAEADKTKKAAEMLVWAQEHGSERLQKGLGQGHRCEKLYAIEHGAWLLNDSDYELDYNSDVGEKDRSCPSLAALEEVEKMKKIDGIEKAKVVWLPNGLQELHKDSEGYIEEQEDGCEAVRVDVENISGMWYKKF